MRRIIIFVIAIFLLVACRHSATVGSSPSGFLATPAWTESRQDGLLLRSGMAFDADGNGRVDGTDVRADLLVGRGEGSGINAFTTLEAAGVGVERINTLLGARLIRTDMPLDAAVDPVNFRAHLYALALINTAVQTASGGPAQKLAALQSVAAAPRMLETLVTQWDVTIVQDQPWFDLLSPDEETLYEILDTLKAAATAEITMPNLLASPQIASVLNGDRSFTVTLSQGENHPLYYTTDATAVTNSATFYEGPFDVADGTTVKVAAIYKGMSSNEITTLVASTLSSAASSVVSSVSSAASSAVAAVCDDISGVWLTDLTISGSCEDNGDYTVPVTVTRESGCTFTLAYDAKSFSGLLEESGAMFISYTLQHTDETETTTIDLLFNGETMSGSGTGQWTWDGGSCTEYLSYSGTLGGTVASSSAAADVAVTFADTNLEAAVREALGRQDSDPIYASQAATLTALEAAGRTITDLSGIEYLSGVYSLDLSQNAITDLTPLQGLTGLRFLVLYNNQIADITPLQGLTQLNQLYLSNNQVADLAPLQGMTSLQLLYIINNQITDISPLSSLTALTMLSLSFNQITDIAPLQTLTLLSSLSLDSNMITTVTSLQGLTGLSALYLTYNRICDFTPVQFVADNGGTLQIDPQQGDLVCP